LELRSRIEGILLYTSELKRGGPLPRLCLESETASAHELVQQPRRHRGRPVRHALNPPRCVPHVVDTYHRVKIARVADVAYPRSATSWIAVTQVSNLGRMCCDFSSRT
jgi:hypothetical protein